MKHDSSLQDSDIKYKLSVIKTPKCSYKGELKMHFAIKCGKFQLQLVLVSLKKFDDNNRLQMPNASFDQMAMRRIRNAGTQLTRICICYDREWDREWEWKWEWEWHRDWEWDWDKGRKQIEFIGGNKSRGNTQSFIIKGRLPWQQSISCSPLFLVLVLFLYIFLLQGSLIPGPYSWRWVSTKNIYICLKLIQNPRKQSLFPCKSTNKFVCISMWVRACDWVNVFVTVCVCACVPYDWSQPKANKLKSLQINKGKFILDSILEP